MESQTNARAGSRLIQVHSSWDGAEEGSSGISVNWRQ